MGPGRGRGGWGPGAVGVCGGGGGVPGAPEGSCGARLGALGRAPSFWEADLGAPGWLSLREIAGARRELHVPLLAVRELQYDPKGPGAIFKDTNLNEVAQTSVLWLRPPPGPKPAAGRDEPSAQEGGQAALDKTNSEEGAAEEGGTGRGRGAPKSSGDADVSGAAASGGAGGWSRWGCVPLRSQLKRSGGVEAGGVKEGEQPSTAEAAETTSPGHLVLINLCPVPTFHFQLRRSWVHAHKQAITASIVSQRWQLAAFRARAGLQDVARRAEALAGLNLSIPTARGDAERDPFASISRVAADGLRQEFSVLQAGVSRPCEVLSGRDIHCMRLIVRACLSRKSPMQRAKAILCASSPVLWAGVASTFTNLAALCLAPQWRPPETRELEKVSLEAEVARADPAIAGGGGWIEAVGDVARCRERLDMWMPNRTSAPGLESSVVWGKTGLDDVERWQKVFPSSTKAERPSDTSGDRAATSWKRLYLCFLRAAAFSKLRLAVSTTRALLKGRHMQCAGIWFPEVGGAEPWGNPHLWGRTGVHIWAEAKHNIRGPPRGRVGQFSGFLFALIASEKADLPVRGAAVEWADVYTPGLKKPSGSEWREFTILACEALYEIQGCIEIANSTGLTSSGVLGHILASLEPTLRQKAACRLFFAMLRTVRESKQSPGTVSNAQWEHVYHIASLLEAIMRSPLAESLVLGDIALEFFDSLALDPWLRQQSAPRDAADDTPSHSNFWEAQMLPKYAHLCQSVLACSREQERDMPWDQWERCTT